jgi:hypothetical protein
LPKLDAIQQRKGNQEPLNIMSALPYLKTTSIETRPGNTSSIDFESTPVQVKPKRLAQEFSDYVTEMDTFINNEMKIQDHRRENSSFKLP